MGIERRHFGVTADGVDVLSYTLTNKNGMQATLITLGGALQALRVPDKHGKLRDVVVGFDDVAGFEQRSDYQGVLVGRYCNRIAGGRMRVGDKTYDLTRNEKGITCLHGGGEFSAAVWTPEVTGENKVAFSYTSPDGAEGFPGEMTACVEYGLTEENELILHYSAVCSADSYINMTNHTYFNLAGSIRRCASAPHVICRRMRTASRRARCVMLRARLSIFGRKRPSAGTSVKMTRSSSNAADMTTTTVSTAAPRPHLPSKRTARAAESACRSIPICPAYSSIPATS